MLITEDTKSQKDLQLSWEKKRSLRFFPMLSQSLNVGSP